MKKFTEIFGADVEVINSTESLKEFNNARGNAGGLPSVDFFMMPLLGRQTFKIDGREIPVTTVCIVYEDASKKQVLKMVSVNSFSRVYKEDASDERAEAKNIEIKDVENAFQLTPTQLINKCKGLIFEFKGLKPLLTPKFVDNQPDWSEPIAKDVQTYATKDAKTAYNKARKFFDEFAKDNDLTNIVKEIETLV